MGNWLNTSHLTTQQIIRIFFLWGGVPHKKKILIIFFFHDLKIRNISRGIGGIFFDDLDSPTPEVKQNLFLK